MRGDARPSVEVRLASPRGFCAGVDRAIQMVERALAKYGAPVYVRHQIVHNRSVVERLAALGAVFVEDVAECPCDRPLVFSAHGAPKAAFREAAERGLFTLDATCPLVSKVHNEAERHHAEGRHVALIGHAGHPEVIGVLGRLPPGAISLIETMRDAEAFESPAGAPLAYVTQTTLAVDEVADIVGVLRARFADIAGPVKEDVCYATTNRQEAVKQLSGGCDLVLVVGSKTSSNSLRLVETALRSGAKIARLIDSAEDIDWAWLKDKAVVGLTAGASSPEALVEKVLEAMAARYDVLVREVASVRESLTFKLPRALAD
ncbi:MAG TPA: 4-hydroxy-3-methylbut-2-enyl diphosphate reductase [Caulobacteraceae bacterium]|nr:4-hydroxy-3-methylbut-2-enyl diphosphate reductase [Caulobacteraceae bacterium]